jgi:hypothetical protein
MLLIQEVVLRILFPIPEVLEFNRAGYAPVSAETGHVERPTMAHAAYRWVSAPDETESLHRMNLYGFRDRTWSLKRPASGLRIAFIGDSFVEGFLAPQEDTIPECFGRAARARALEVETMNLGMGAGGLAEYYPILRDTTALFAPDDAFVVLYQNDFYSPKTGPAWSEPPLAPILSSAWKPRLLEVLAYRDTYGSVPCRWRSSPFSFLPPLGDPRHPWTDPAKRAGVEPFLPPAIAQAIREARFNPYVVGFMDLQERVLPKPDDVGPQLAALHDLLADSPTRLWMAYIPSLIQVSDRYLEAQAELTGMPPHSFLGERYQAQARSLGEACSELGLPFLDLTPRLREADAQGEELYWKYDGHMKSAGYRVVGEALFAWWQAERASAD